MLKDTLQNASSDTRTHTHTHSDTRFQ